MIKGHVYWGQAYWGDVVGVVGAYNALQSRGEGVVLRGAHRVRTRAGTVDHALLDPGYIASCRVIGDGDGEGDAGRPVARLLRLSYKGQRGYQRNL